MEANTFKLLPGSSTTINFWPHKGGWSLLRVATKRGTTVFLERDDNSVSKENLHYLSSPGTYIIFDHQELTLSYITRNLHYLSSPGHPQQSSLAWGLENPGLEHNSKRTCNGAKPTLTQNQDMRLSHRTWRPLYKFPKMWSIVTNPTRQQNAN